MPTITSFPTSEALADPRPLIVTALLEPVTQARFESLRRAHFPPERNHIPAHLTLFHHLPGSELAAIRLRLKRLAGEYPPPAATVASVQYTGNGVSFRLHSPELDAVRADLADAWATLLIPQDRNGFRPHVTVQNKVVATVARDTHRQLAAAFAPWPTRVVALALWRYLGGPWEPLGHVAFRGR